MDSKSQVYVFIRGIDPVLVFDSQGNFLRSWGRDYFTWPHGLYVGPDDSIYCTDGEGRVYVADRENSRIQLFDLIRLL